MANPEIKLESYESYISRVQENSKSSLKEFSFSPQTQFFAKYEDKILDNILLHPSYEQRISDLNNKNPPSYDAYIKQLAMPSAETSASAMKIKQAKHLKDSTDIEVDNTKCVSYADYIVKISNESFLTAKQNTFARQIADANSFSPSYGYESALLESVSILQKSFLEELEKISNDDEQPSYLKHLQAAIKNMTTPRSYVTHIASIAKMFSKAEESRSYSSRIVSLEASLLKQSERHSFARHIAAANGVLDAPDLTTVKSLIILLRLQRFLPPVPCPAKDVKQIVSLFRLWKLNQADCKPATADFDSAKRSLYSVVLKIPSQLLCAVLSYTVRIFAALGPIRKSLLYVHIRLLKLARALFDRLKSLKFR